MQGVCAAIFVRKDLAHQTDLVRMSIQPALRDTMFWEFQIVYGNETLAWFSFDLDPGKPALWASARAGLIQQISFNRYHSAGLTCGI